MNVENFTQNRDRILHRAAPAETLYRCNLHGRAFSLITTLFRTTELVLEWGENSDFTLVQKYIFFSFHKLLQK